MGKFYYVAIGDSKHEPIAAMLTDNKLAATQYGAKWYITPTEVEAETYEEAKKKLGVTILPDLQAPYTTVRITPEGVVE